MHNGGDLHFGADGYLYLGLGDAGNPYVYNANSQDLHRFHGKMLRIDVDRKQDTLEYAIPADNPFFGSPDSLVRQEIYAYGFRQPWRWSFDPLDGSLILADVGDWVQEEVDIVQKGRNYGWSIAEGNTCFNRTDEFTPLALCDTTGLAPPIAVLDHVPISSQPTASITGGYVFRRNPASRFYGTYFFGDWVTRKLYALSQGVISEVGTAPDQMSAFGTDSAGNIYLVGYNNGVIYRLDHPDLQSAVMPSRPVSKAKELSRRGGKWWFDAKTFPGLEEFRIVDLQGRTRLFLHRDLLFGGCEAALPSGIYLVTGLGKDRGQAFTLLLK